MFLRYRNSTFISSLYLSTVEFLDFFPSLAELEVVFKGSSAQPKVGKKEPSGAHKYFFKRYAPERFRELIENQPEEEVVLTFLIL